MPLSHVCVWDADIGYKRISLESACKMYPNGASAKSGYFVCELCAQNVLLTAPGVNVRHFRHDPSSPNKECDERQAHFDPLYGRRLRNLNSHLMPLRITVAKESFATVYKGNIIKNLIMDCQSYTKYRPNETTGGIFVSWRRKEELPTGA